MDLCVSTVEQEHRVVLEGIDVLGAAQDRGKVSSPPSSAVAFGSG